LATRQLSDPDVAAQMRKLAEWQLHYGKIYIARPQFAVRMYLDGGDEI
jgi:hypothetical protein